MPEFVLRHPKLPGQPIIVPANEEADITDEASEWSRAGWKLAKTKPEDVPVAPTHEPAEPVNTTKEK